MADEAMNLDLNLGPGDNSGDGNEAMPVSDGLDDAINLEDWLRSNPAHRAPEILRHRNPRWRSLWRQFPIPPETLNLAMELIGGSEVALHSGEGSIASEETPTEAPKVCENGVGRVEDDVQGKKKESVKNNGNEGCFFDCSICLDLAREPVVTCCGHLFCWPCLYRWLHHHSDAKECPVCKGEVSVKNVTPIYGRGDTARGLDTDSSLKVPLRPQACRIESWRQTIQRAAFSIPMEEMIRRRLGSTYDLSWEVSQTPSQSSDGVRESLERSNAVLSRLLTSRGLRRERGGNVIPYPANEANAGAGTGGGIYDRRDSRRLTSLLLGRSNSNSNSDGGERRDGGTLGEGEGGRRVDDRDSSLSSIAAVIQSVEEEDNDNGVETESTTLLSLSSSRDRRRRRRRRRGYGYDGSTRISDVDSGESRRARRRRQTLN